MHTAPKIPVTQKTQTFPIMDNFFFRIIFEYVYCVCISMDLPYNLFHRKRRTKNRLRERERQREQSKFLCSFFFIHFMLELLQLLLHSDKVSQWQFLISALTFFHPAMSALLFVFFFFSFFLLPILWHSTFGIVKLTITMNFPFNFPMFRLSFDTAD